VNWLRDRSLAIALMAMFVASGAGQLFTGLHLWEALFDG
jgi:hypothetical protein